MTTITAPKSLKYLILTASLCCMLAIPLQVYANDIQIQNLKLVGNIPDEGLGILQFDLSWENSWRTNNLNDVGITNWDAAWVFIKFRETSDQASAWSHLYLSNNAADYSTGTWQGAGPGPALIEPALADPRLNSAGNLLTPFSPAVNGNPIGQNPVVGAFVYRQNTGSGRFDVKDMRFAFDPVENGLDSSKLYDFQVFAIEMVFVPEGSFFAGSGGSETGRFKDGSTNNPFLIDADWNAANAEGGRRIANVAGQLWGSSTRDDSIGPTSATTPLADSWPTGFNAFYMMKYAITQQQYVDFLNTLSFTQQNERIDGSPASAAGTFTRGTIRNRIRIDTPGINPGKPAVYATEKPFVANNWIIWQDGAAYMDWAGLRPFTELEYEKAARGFADPVANEFAWGTTNITFATGISDAGLATETASNAGANAVGLNRGTGGPLRVGAFATETSTREQAGASFWGIMELSGNLWERPVTIGTATGRAFTGLHGNGLLSAAGNATIANWPGLVSGQVTGADGSGFRGAGWQLTTLNWLRISDRSFANLIVSGRTDENRRYGFRGVRSSPATGTGTESQN
ncbi:MAG: formylglycine-generating enzyme family protein [Candidatus Cyclonatronum sp.]|uniref:SUMF1/EgtB/PvdO family nonheme iron enzyme n=1 Tax=Cyclonatronum sp. TaxID=3024185 RepID=UPI0025C383DB|nr:SUMF1/EgtB/PvdO family nonheme iron enzyme [Cyclonatronum sp.]MCH8487847.1 formylglycine-generating enzyme family protein [Cyclonatronum sp.]